MQRREKESRIASVLEGVRFTLFTHATGT